MRVSYAFYLIEKMNQKHQALEEFNFAEKNRPPLDIQFIIYRQKYFLLLEISILF